MKSISFYSYSKPKNKLEKRIHSMLNVPDLNGDWLNSKPDLDIIENKCKHALTTAPGFKNQLKYANPLKVVREVNSVYIIRIGIQTGKVEKLCGFEVLNNSS